MKPAGEVSLQGRGEKHIPQDGSYDYAVEAPHMIATILIFFNVPLQTCLDETIILQTSTSFSFPVIIWSGSVHNSCQLISCALFICLGASFLI